MMNVLYAFNIGDKMSFILVSGPGMGRKMGLPAIRFNLKGQPRKWVSGFSVVAKYINRGRIIYISSALPFARLAVHGKRIGGGYFN